MHNFKDMGITAPHQGFVGDKIKMDRILNREIVVLDYRIEDSKVKQGDKCLYLQIEYDGKKHVMFTGSKTLMEIIKQIPAKNFPFTTTIIKELDRPTFS